MALPDLSDYLGVELDAEVANSAVDDAALTVDREHDADIPENIRERLILLLAARLVSRGQAAFGVAQAGEFGFNVRSFDVDYDRLGAPWRKMTWA